MRYFTRSHESNIFCAKENGGSARTALAVRHDQLITVTATRNVAAIVAVAGGVGAVPHTVAYLCAPRETRWRCAAGMEELFSFTVEMRSTDRAFLAAGGFDLHARYDWRKRNMGNTGPEQRRLDEWGESPAELICGLLQSIWLKMARPRRSSLATRHSWSSTLGGGAARPGADTTRCRSQAWSQPIIAASSAGQR